MPIRHAPLHVFLTGIPTVVLILGAAVIEISHLIAGDPLPVGVRQWLLSTAVIGVVATGCGWKIASDRYSVRQQITDRITEIVDQRLSAQLTQAQLTKVVHDAIAPTLFAMTDMVEAAPRITPPIPPGTTDPSQN